jgi:amidophosphoribosyltransferase
MVCDQEEQGGFYIHRARGLVEHIFSERIVKELTGKAALGHSRYSTIGQNDTCLLQPFIDDNTGIGLGHNGTIVNFYALMQEQASNGTQHSAVESDSALILDLLTTRLRGQEVTAKTVFAAIEFCTAQLVGSYSVVCLTKNGDIFGFRDPNGIRPLVFGKRQSEDEGSIYGLASETIALNYLGFDQTEDVLPGEAIYISSQGQVDRKIIKKDTFAPCMFEWVYFARVESEFQGKSVYEARFKLGQILAKQIKVRGISADVVIPVPETSRASAIALAESLDVPFRELLIKNRYINRTFILDHQTSRQEAIRRKLFPIAQEIRGKHCLIVDDSIVRGNTASQIIKLLRQSGAREITLVSTCPPIINPCYYGIDFPSVSELIAHGKTEEEIATTLGADRLIFQTLEGLKEALDQESLCLGCLTGQYPTSTSSSLDFETMRLKDRSDYVSERK